MGNFAVLHMLQSVPAHCMNRDDLGNVKTLTFGDALRGRVSSQSWKRQISEKIMNDLGLSALRSKRYPDHIYQALIKEGASKSKAFEIATNLFIVKNKGLFKTPLKKFDETFGKPFDPEKYSPESFETSTLLFFSKSEIDKIVSKIVNDSFVVTDSILEIIKKVQKDSTEEKSRIGAIIALFGRMVAQEPEIDVNGASSFNHAHTTHEISMESDYFSAMDDMKDEKGAGHIDSASFSSGVFYRCIVLDINTLKSNLPAFDNGEIKRVVEAWFDACINAFPSGKSKTFFSKTLPSYILLESRKDVLSYANAFESPVISCNGDGLLAPSIAALHHHIKFMKDYLGNTPISQLELYDWKAVNKNTLPDVELKFPKLEDFKTFASSLVDGTVVSN